MAFGYILSIIVHLLALCIIALSFSWNKKPILLNPEPINIKIVNISEKTRLKKQKKVRKPEKGKSKIFKSKTKEKKKIEKLPLKIKPKDVKPLKKEPTVPIKKKKVELKEIKKEPIKEKIVQKLPVEKEKKKVEKKVEEKIIPKQRPVFEKQQKKAEKKVEDDFENVLKAVSDMRKKDLNAEKSKKAEKTIVNKVEKDAEKLTISDIDALRSQLSRCWTPPSGIKKAEEIVVEIDLVLNAKAQVESAKIVDQGRLLKDQTYKVAAEAALRALKHPSCVPLNLPKEKYALWKSFRLVFNPKEMFQ